MSSEQPEVSHAHRKEEETFHGPSSNISFLQQTIQRANPDLVEKPCAQEGTKSDLLGFEVVRPPDSAHNVGPHSPPDHLVPTLLRTFYDSIHPVFPLLHWSSFTTMYNSIGRPNMTLDDCHYQARDDLVFHAILNMVLALGCQRSKDALLSQRKQYADSFYRRSQRLVSIETLDFASLEIVQLLLLRGIYLHYTSYANRCWNMVGVALRVAQSLGLNFEHAASSKSQLEREMRRRVWHNCIALDRLSATTFGRPVLHCKPHAIPLPEPIDDEYLSEVNEGCQPENIPSRIDFFIHSIRLFEVLDETLSRFYSNGYQRPGQDRTSTSFQYLEDIPRLCSKLDIVVAGLPAHLVLDGTMEAANESTSCFRMQAMVLKSRVLYIRLLLLRPSLLVEVRRLVSNQSPIYRHPTPSLKQIFLGEISRLCVSTAHEIVDEMYQNLSSSQQNSPWHALFFTFGAASALLAASLFPDLGVDLDAGPAKDSWDKALEVFYHYESNVESAARGAEALKKYRQRFSAFLKQDGQTKSERSRTVSSSISDNAPVEAAIDENWLAGMSEDFNAFFTSDSLEQSWLSSQGIDWGMDGYFANQTWQLGDLDF
ncbi:hypothetical protein FPOA_06639 [Fusarium poae]|uniref:Xylanolytic transcriptional activator regulatory domain-containing protein n=1 Tax=Fusarium poae TaxID=36050 RepID=A0A1B8AIX4_FUSPO|nr:hypothetical protein FPOA_06639 [Fusarium poae]